jgi:hypothetical protein
MADKHGAHQTGLAYITSVTEDYCKSPTAPVGYMLTQFLDQTVRVTNSVRWCGTPLLNMDTRFTCVLGNEAGCGGGVVSGVNKGWCKPVKSPAFNVNSEGNLVLRHGTFMEMNASTPDGVGNTVGVMKYISRDSIPSRPPDTLQCFGTPPALDSWMWVDIDFNDLAHTGLAVAMIPIAGALKLIGSIFPEFESLIVSALPKTEAGTGDKSGLGVLIGDNSGEGSPGVVGLAFSLAKKILSPLSSDGGVIDGVRFEIGQSDEGHNGKTGVGFESDSLNSFGETLGQLFGIVFHKLGLGDIFYTVVEAILGPPDGYGFVSGVWKGTRQLPA